MQKAMFVLLALAVAALAGLLFWTKSAEDASVAANSESAQSEASFRLARPADLPDGGLQRTGDGLIDLVRSSDGVWSRELYGELARLSASDLIEILRDPAVADTPPAKQMLAAVLESCLPLLNPHIDVSADPTLPSGENASRWCSGLTEKHDWEELSGLYSRLAGDPDTASSQAVLLAQVDADVVPAVETIDGLRSAALNSSNPYESVAATRALLYNSAIHGTPDVPIFRALNPSQRNQVSDVVQAMAACRIAGECGANSPWVVDFCMSRPGLRCRSGADLWQLATDNLSPVERDALQHVWRELFVDGGDA